MDKNSITYRAAVYFAQYHGQRGTAKQVEKLIKTLGPHIIRMAQERGFKI